MFNSSEVLNIIELGQHYIYWTIVKKALRSMFKRMSTYTRNADESKGEVQRDKSAYRWRELGGDSKQEPGNTLTKEIYW